MRQCLSTVKPLPPLLAFAKPARQVLGHHAGRKAIKYLGRPWSRLKTEVLTARNWRALIDLAEVQANVATSFDYYNHKHLHSHIGYQTPITLKRTTSQIG